jgi:hypothetical protein
MLLNYNSYPLRHVRALLRKEGIPFKIVANDTTPAQRARRREVVGQFYVVLDDVMEHSPLWPLCARFFPGRCAVLGDHLAEVVRWAFVYIDEGTREVFSAFRHYLDTWGGDVIEANEDVALALKNHTATVRIGKL